MRTVNIAWNRRPLSPADEATTFVCRECEQSHEWTQRGSAPERCYPCARLHVTRTMTGEGTDTPWDMTRAGEGDVFERLENLLHWSPSKQRWLYHDGNRWVLGAEVEAYRVVLAVLRTMGRVSTRKQAKRKGSGHREVIEEVMNLYRSSCEQKVATHGGC